MTDNSASKRQAAVVAALMSQGYSQAHSIKVAKQLHPTPAQARMAQARAAKVRPAAGRHTTAGLKSIAAASSASNKARWARVRELGLKNLKQLAQYERGELPA